MQLSDIGEQSVDKGSRQHQMSAAVVLRWAALDSNYTPTIYPNTLPLFPLALPGQIQGICNGNKLRTLHKLLSFYGSAENCLRQDSRLHSRLATKGMK